MSYVRATRTIQVRGHCGLDQGGGSQGRGEGGQTLVAVSKCCQENLLNKIHVREGARGARKREEEGEEEAVSEEENAGENSNCKVP